MNILVPYKKIYYKIQRYNHIYAKSIKITFYYLRCIQKFMKDKIRILITHQIHYLENSTKIMLLQNGKIKAYGSYDKITRSGIDMNQMFEKINDDKQINSRKASLISHQSEIEKLSIAESIETNDDLYYDVQSIKSQNLEVSISKDGRPSISIKNKFNETSTLGNLTWKIYFIYFKTGGGLFGAAIYFLMLIASQVFVTSGDYFINYWATTETLDYSIKMNNILNLTNSTNGVNSSNFHEIQSASISVFEKRMDYYFIYFLLNISGVLSIGIAATLFYIICLRASKKLHSSMFNSVILSPVRFFDLNPLGRILNRFSKDMSSVDEEIPATVYDFVQNLVTISSSIFLTVVINYWIIFPLIPLTIAFVYIRRYFLVSSIEIKRIDALSKSFLNGRI